MDLFLCDGQGAVFDVAAKNWRDARFTDKSDVQHEYLFVAVDGPVGQYSRDFGLVAWQRWHVWVRHELTHPARRSNMPVRQGDV